MSVRVLRFTATDWANALLLLVAEIVIAWLAINLLLTPSGDGTNAMSATTVTLLMAAAMVVPRLCHDWGIWGPHFSIVLVAGVLLTTAIAVQQTSFPDYALTDPAWIDEALAALIREPSSEQAPVWIVILSSAAIWWRGVMRGRSDIDSGLALLRVGSAVLVGLVVAHTLIDRGIPDRQLSAAVLIFFSSVLLAIAMMRQEMAPWRSTIRWAETVLAPVGLIILPTAIVIGLLTRDLSGMVDLLLDPVILILTLVLRILGFVLVLLAMIILIPIVWLISLLPVSQPGEANETPFQIARGTISRASEAGTELPSTFKYLIATILIMLLFAGIARFRLRLGFAQLDDERDRHLVKVQGSFMHGLKLWLDSVLHRRSETDGDPLASLRADDRWRHTVRIRDRYADFLRWSSQQGMSRRVSTTADELQEQWADERSARQADAVLTLTTLYDRARYGGAPMSESDANAMDEAWRLLQDKATVS